MNSYKPCLKHHPQEVHPFQAKYYSSQKSLLVCNCTWIYIWAVHESLSKYGTFICFPGGHTELGNNLLWADALLKYNTVLENTPHRLDRKYRKVSSAATWVCFIQFNSDLIFFSFTTSLRAVQPWKPCHLTLLQTQHMALQVLSWPSISKAAHPLLLAQTLAAPTPVSIDPSESWACSKCVVFPPTPPLFFFFVFCWLSRLICPVEGTDKHQSCKGTSKAVRCCGTGAGEEEGHQGNPSSGAANCSID